MAYLPILTYHRLLKEAPTHAADPKRIAVSQAQFRSHLALLKRFGYRSVSLAEYPAMLRQNLPPRGRSFAISFDDGYEEVLTLALPVLQELGFTATVFAVPGELGGTNAWDQGTARLLNALQLRMLQQSGITIGAHTTNHAHLTHVTLQLAKYEVADSKRQLEEVLGKPVTTFAYPYGESNPRIEALVQQTGFEAAFATDRAPRNHILNLYRLRRVVVFPRTTPREILWKVQRWYPAYQDWRRRDTPVKEA